MSDPDVSAVMEETNETPERATPALAWSAFYDDKGEIFYYNSTTEQSAWDPPEEGFNPPEGEPPSGKEKHDTVVVHDWSAHYDDQGDLYYYNSATQESAWEAPSEPFNPPEEPQPDPAEPEKDALEPAAKETDIVAQPGEGTDPNTEPDTEPPSEVTTPAEPVAAKPPSEGAAPGEPSATELPDDPMDTPAVATDPPDEGPTPAEPDATKPPDEGTTPAEPDATEPPDDPTDTPAEAVNETKGPYGWSAHYDEEGRLYYFNAVTEESAWEAPSEGFNPPDESAPPAETVDAAATGAATWAMYKDDDQRDYYYNLVTGESRWDRPDDFDGEPEAPEDTAESDAKSPSAAVDTEPDDTGEIEIEPEPEVEEPEPEEEIDPAVQRLQDAQIALKSSDSVLEPSCMSNVAVVVADNGGNPAKAIAALIENYHGQTAVCGLLSRWLVDLNQKRQGTAAKDTASKLPSLTNHDTYNADKIREVVQQVINKMAKERFTKDAGDGILDLSKSEAAFLEEMMDSPRWRTLLIDLSAVHKDSAVLLYCLRAISKRGHHREIARRINQSDHFAVYNAMLLSELSVIGCQAISAGSDISSGTGLEELIQDLTRACSSTSYTYLYALELLRRLESMARHEMSQWEASNSTNGMLHERFRRAVRKWEGLIQTLESSMVDPSAPQSVAGSSPLLRKRRLDIALTISELYQGQMRRKRLRLTGHSSHSNGHDASHLGTLETGLLTLLKRHSIGIQLEDAVLDKLLPSGLDMDTKGIGDLLLRHPMAIRALLGHLYKPGQTRVISPSTKNKCGRLVALAMIAAESAAKNEYGTSLNGSDEAPDDLAISRMIVQGSQLCEQVETMISFLVTTESDKPEQVSTSVGQKLCALALKCAPVGLGVVIWAREFTQGREYAASASFPTISPSILSLVRLVALKHPFARSDALTIALAFLRHSNSEISYQKVNSIKETSLRLLLHLLAKGDIVPVLSSLLVRVRQVESSEIDASLIRYFVGGVLEIAQPPVSPVFVLMFGRFLNSPKVLDAVRSNYFSDANRKRLSELLLSFKSVRSTSMSPLSKEDSSMLSALLSSYQVEV